MPTASQIRDNSIRRCQETVIGPCGADAAGCCGIVSCNLCVKVTDYGEVVGGALAPFVDNGYAATVYGHTFSGVWSVDYEGNCVFTVTIDEGTYSEQVLEYGCYDSPCRAASGSVDVSDGVLSWEVSEPIPIARRSVNGCLDEFCGSCGCAPPKICVTVFGTSCEASGLFPFSGTLNACGEATTVEYDFSLVCGNQTVEGTVALVRNQYTDACELSVSVTGDSDQTVEASCAINGTADLTLEYEEYTIQFSDAWCEFCLPVGVCPDCDEVAQTLFADVSPQDWQPALGCDPGTLCFSPFTIGLTFVFDPTIGIAGEWRWRGSQGFSCTGCDTGGNPGFEDPVEYVAELDLGCDGKAYFTITQADDDSELCQEEFSFELPCVPDDWDISWSTALGWCAQVCCNEAGFDIHVTE